MLRRISSDCGKSVIKPIACNDMAEPCCISNTVFEAQLLEGVGIKAKQDSDEMPILTL
jgi:hypothetical protein